MILCRTLRHYTHTTARARCLSVFHAKESGWVLTDEIRSIARSRCKTLFQSRLVEDGFLRERRQEQRSMNSELSNESIWYCLLTKHVLDHVYNFDTQCLSSLSGARQDVLPPNTFKGSAADISIDLSEVRGYSNRASWETCTPSSQVRYVVELGVAAYAHENNTWEEQDTLSMTAGNTCMGLRQCLLLFSRIKQTHTHCSKLRNRIVPFWRALMVKVAHYVLVSPCPTQEKCWVPGL